MELAGLYHRIDGTYGYQNQDRSFTIRLRSKKNEIKKVSIIYGDRYNSKLIDEKAKIWEWQIESKKEMPKIISSSIYDYHEITLSDKNNEHRYKYIFVIEDHFNHKYAYGESILKKITTELTPSQINEYGFAWGYSHIGKYISAPEWWKQTNWYQIFPDRFHNSKGNWQQNLKLDLKSNGKLNGITQNLDYIKSLGFNGIYLNPIFESNSPHMYDTIDYNQIAKSLGTEADFQKLIAELKKRNMKIMLDGVFNHSGTHFLPWKDVLANKEKSQYKDWFVINNFANLKKLEDYKADFSNPQTKPYSTFANTPSMPRLNWSNQGLLNYLKQVVKKWTKMGIDAWRLDVADEPSFVFWRKFRNWVKSENPDIAILGEIWHDSKVFLNGDQFDATMNYKFRTNAIDFIVNNKISFNQFKSDYFENAMRYSKPINDSQFNLITSHDTSRTSYLTKGNVLKNKALFTWLFLNPGATSFYYGDEYLETFNQETPEAGRIPFDWNFDQKSSLFLHVKNILAWRKKHINSIISGIKDLKQNGDYIKVAYNDHKIVDFNFKNGAFQAQN